jgi:hypothetical protein
LRTVPTTAWDQPNARIRVVVLPNSSKAVIAPEKLRDYLLSPTHPIGRYKALFFRTLGYDETSWQELESQLRSLLARPAEPLESTEYGTKYAIIAPLTGRNGRMAEIVTVWIILAGEETPRFVTAYPKD